MASRRKDMLSRKDLSVPSLSINQGVFNSAGFRVVVWGNGDRGEVWGLGRG